MRTVCVHSIHIWRFLPDSHDRIACPAKPFGIALGLAATACPERPWGRLGAWATSAIAACPQENTLAVAAYGDYSDTTSACPQEAPLAEVASVPRRRHGLPRDRSVGRGDWQHRQATVSTGDWRLGARHRCQLPVPLPSRLCRCATRLPSTTTLGHRLPT